MMAILVWWFALPTIARRLTGAVLVFGAVVGAILLYGHHREASGYTRGYSRAADSVWKKEIQHKQVVLDSMEAVAVTSHQAAVDSAAAVDREASRFVARPQGVRLEPLPDSFARAPAADMVRVTVESTGEVFDVPRGAAQYWKTADSLVAVASALLEKYARANAQWASAWSDEHAAREGADSLAATYAERLRSVELRPAAQPHMHRIAYLVVGAAVALVARNQFHR